MKTSLLAILLLASGASYANEAVDEAANRAAFGAERSRAEVKAEFQAAKQAGHVSMNDYELQRPAAAQGVRSRSDARAEAVQAARTRVIHEQI